MRAKYPRTFHLPWSLGYTSDDKVLNSVSHFEGKEVVVTEKVDGECTTGYSDGYSHARSLDSAHHKSRSWFKGCVAPMLNGNLPDGWRVCGENLFAKHALAYDRLPGTYFLVFAIYDDKNRCLSWDETVEWCELLGLIPVPVLYRGVWDEEAIKAAWSGKSRFGDEGEGYVVRVADGFEYEDFADSVAKFVRANHVQQNPEGPKVHWSLLPVTPNSFGE